MRRAWRTAGAACIVTSMICAEPQLLAPTHATIFNGTAIVGPAAYFGGPVTGEFDQPYLALNISGLVQGYTSNAKTYLYSKGVGTDSRLPTPVYTGLGPSPNESDFDFCGAWINAAVVDDTATSPLNASLPLIRVWYHEEWQCDYAHDFQTNKSIAYAESWDGGFTFVKPHHPLNYIITGANTTDAQQTGEGDHGALKWGANFYYLFFIDWNGYNGDATISLARSSVADGGVPGTWFKYCNGSFDCPGITGASDMISGITGTAAVDYPPLSSMMAVGTHGTNHPTLSFSADGINWEAMSTPLQYLASGNWNRSVAPSLELFGYWSVLGPGGNAGKDMGPHLDVFATYWPPGSVERYLIRRSLDMYSHLQVACSVNDAGVLEGENENVCDPQGSYVSPPSLIAISTYTNASLGSSWSTTSVVLPGSGYTDGAVIAYVLTSNTSDWFGNGTSTNTTLVAIYECQRPSPSPAAADGLDHLVTLEGECTTVSSGTEVRPLGWLWVSPRGAYSASALADTRTGTSKTQPSQDGATAGGCRRGDAQIVGNADKRGAPTENACAGADARDNSPLLVGSTFIGTVYRCVNATSGLHFCTFNDATCVGQVLDRMLGYGYAPPLAA